MVELLIDEVHQRRVAAVLHLQRQKTTTPAENVSFQAVLGMKSASTWPEALPEGLLHGIYTFTYYLWRPSTTQSTTYSMVLLASTKSLPQGFQRHLNIGCLMGMVATAAVGMQAM